MKDEKGRGRWEKVSKKKNVLHFGYRKNLTNSIILEWKKENKAEDNIILKIHFDSWYTIGFYTGEKFSGKDLKNFFFHEQSS